MKYIYGIAAGIALLANSAAAQDGAQMKLEQMKAELEKMLSTSKIVAARGGVMGKTVKGAPYSGQEINESSQILGDGTRIHNEARATVYRDSEGRVRRETGDQVTIWDPVANMNYSLDQKNMTAVKLPMMPAQFQVFERKIAAEQAVAGRAGTIGGFRTADGASGSVSVKDGIVIKDGIAIPIGPDGTFVSDDGRLKATVRQSSGATGAGTVSTFMVREDQITITKDGQTTTTPLPHDMPIGGDVFRYRVPAPAMAIAGGAFGPIHDPLANVKTEPLGDQVLEGVKARGSRMTSTIEVGKIGNDRPLNTVNERWYSDELQTEIMNRRSDPRSGEQTFRLVNINRGEPASYLFQVPSSYTVTERK